MEQRTLFLDGMRGVASVMVVFYHLFFGFFGYKWGEHSKWYLKFISDGQLAVFVFFVISGFALSTYFVKTRDDRILTSLALRRYLRLTIPIFASCFLAYLLMTTGLLYNIQAAKLLPKGNWLEFWLMPLPSWDNLLKFVFSDVYFKYEVRESYNNVLWTMGPELTGSFLIFCVLALVGKIERRFVVYLGLCWFFWATESRLLPFVFGLVLAELDILSQFVAFQRHPASKYVGGALCLGVFLYASFDTASHHKSNIVSLAAVLMVLGVMLCSPLNWLLRSRGALFLGSISFPLYLTHMLVLCSFSAYLYIRLLESGFDKHAAKNTTIALSLVVCLLAALAFRPVERFAVAISRRFANLMLFNRASAMTPDARRANRS